MYISKKWFKKNSYPRLEEYYAFVMYISKKWFKKNSYPHLEEYYGFYI
jgi:hypothetical protein